MKEYGLTVLIAATVTYLLTPLVRKFAIWFGAWHEPRERDVHTDPVPELGGLAIYCGLAAALLVASRMFPLSGVFAGTRVGSGLLLAGGVVVLMGVVDDRWGLGALTKLAGQVGAGAILVWSGAVVDWLPEPGRGTLVLTSDEGTALTILLVALTINAVNFIDGLDGLATGIVGIGAAAFYLYYYTLAKRLGLSEQTDPALASAVLAGVCLGFLPHNFHPARIFLGDTGAMLLGLLLAYVPISSLATLDPNTLNSPSAYSGGTVNRFPEILPLLLPATILLIPYVDLLLAVVRRTRAGLSPWQADKKHLHHRLLDIGHSHRTSVLIMYLWATLFAGTVVLLSIIRTKLPVLGVVTLAGFLVLLWLTMPRLRPWGRRSAPRLTPAGTIPPPAVTAPVATAVAAAAPADPRLARPAAEAALTGRDRTAGYAGPAAYDPPDAYDAPARYDTLAGYGVTDPRTAAAAGLGGLSGREGRSAAGLSGPGPLDAGRPGDERGGRRYASHGENGQLDRGHRYPAGDEAGNGLPGGSPADAGYPDHYPASPAAPGGAGPAAAGDASRAGPPWEGPAERRWDAPAEPGETEPEDAQEQPEPGRPAWPGEYPETQDPLLPWRSS
jgi:UDP-GlcNAc:undecaprenyl-phosphate GlcNAc-1-phosphate transferase